MSAETDRLIADRGSSLSLRQKQVLRGVGRGDVRFNPNGLDRSNWWAGTYQHVHVATLRSLETRGLIRRPARRGNETEAAWELTYPDGYTLAERLRLIERADVTVGSPGDLYDPPPLEASR